ncbi:MAG TPA: DUF1800 family protein [Xanthobacteraceae bacterium]|nr:DUF1800 family protein [Xanthobacteraceae bacterium]
MALDPKDTKTLAALALHRFGLGPRAGSVAAIASDPRGALLAELDRPNAGRLAAADLMDSGTALRSAVEFQQARRQIRREANGQNTPQQKNAKQDSVQPKNAQPPEAPPESPQQKNAQQKSAQGNAQGKGAPRPRPTVGVAPQEIYIAEAKARLDAALAADTGFTERLVWFWSNHFCVSADKGQVRPIAGAFEREAIRGHVLGRFGDMLLAVESHPAMLIYLDNARSIGPNSPAGRNRRRGLNENLAREILELHTLGVRSVYTQDDVTNFAKVITGWTVVPARQDPELGGTFNFNPRMHETGPQSVIGKRYDAAGVEQGRRVLADLARHPATAKHIAQKFARHFISDEPPPALIDRLTKRFLDTGGDLKELAKTLITSDEAWDPSRARFKRPTEWIVGSLRALGAKPEDVRPLVQAQNLLGEPLWRPPAPNGFADDNATWLDGVSQRLDLANQFARRNAGEADPMAVFEQTVAPFASDDTRRTIARAESRPQALALLLMSPEFQRR